MTRVAFITGGASGIGAASARLLHDNGYFIYIGDVQVDKGRALAQQLERAEFLELNVREEAHFERAFARIVEQHDRLDCMVNNAAIVGVLGPIAKLPLEQYDYSQAVIQRSVIIGTKHAARMMQAQKSGAIINIASVAGLAGGYSPHTYAACKAAVVHFSKSVALELAEDNVRVNAICPGNIATPIHTGVQDARWLERIQKVRAAASDDQPLPRMGEPEEIAQAVLWLASEAASYITGHALVVDGGLMGGRLWRRQPPYFREYRPARS
jgi:NAD(P)-dependent dehydrogenase (short-subunit alcohol dehydrogenase family)